MKRTVALLSLLALLQQPVVAKETKPKYEPLSVADVIETVADYDIHKMTTPPLYDDFGGWQTYFGVTDMTHKTMDLNRVINREQMLLTVLHEMRHVSNHNKGLSNKESWTREYSCKDYKLFFNKEECPVQDDLEKAVRFEYR